MKRRTAVFAILCTGLVVTGWQAVSQSSPGKVLVLETFETPESAGRWQGSLEISTSRASQGNRSARVRLDQDRPEIHSGKLAGDWRGYDRLLFDIYDERDGVTTATVRIYGKPFLSTETMRQNRDVPGRTRLGP